MAQIGRAKKDNHLYILVGPNQGTRQIDDEGVKWLQRENYTIPDPGERTYLDKGTYCYLRDNGYLYIHNILYEDHEIEEHEISAQPKSETIPTGVPLLLQLQEQQRPPWILVADISQLTEDKKVWDELQHSQATHVTMSGISSSLRWKALLNEFCPLKICPQALPYQIYGLNDTGKNNRQVLQTAPETPGLLDNWQGNVFAPSIQRENLWRRCFPGSTISFSSSFLWLAKNGCKPGWPGKAVAIRKEDLGWSVEFGWQLWELTVDNSTPVLLEVVTKWFSHRGINLIQQHQGLRLISPPEAITSDNRFINILSQPIYIQCDIPHRQLEGIIKQVSLSVVEVNKNPSQFQEPFSGSLEQIPTDQVSYFNWKAQHPGRYRISLQGDIDAEPLHLHIITKSLAHPHWLHGLNCTIRSSQKLQIFHAFKDKCHPEQDEKEDELNCFSPKDLSAATWAFEPNSLPIRVSWESTSVQGKWDRSSRGPIQSEEELTTCWQEHIWPSFVNNSKAKIALDAGSFGLIELSVVSLKEDVEWWTNMHLLTQVIWLSHVVSRKHDQSQMVVPRTLRETILQLRNQTVKQIFLYNAFNQLATTTTMPAWVLNRLHILLAEIQQIQNDAPERSALQYHKSE